MKGLIVSEVFYSIQGEGITMGCPSVFLRLAGCNLLCKSATWICDTIEVWKRGRTTAFENVLSAEMLVHLRHGAHLVITGGEPLLHQNKIDDYIIWLYQTHNIVPVIEIETNATVPVERLNGRTITWNISPKLSNSGMPVNRRINEVALDTLKRQKSKQYKFVVASEGDVFEIMSEYGDLIDMNSVCLMQAGATQEELAITRPIVVELCKQFGFRYSDRLHVVTWNKKTGV